MVKQTSGGPDEVEKEEMQGRAGDGRILLDEDEPCSLEEKQRATRASALCVDRLVVLLETDRAWHNSAMPRWVHPCQKHARASPPLGNRTPWPRLNSSYTAPAQRLLAAFWLAEATACSKAGQVTRTGIFTIITARSQSAVHCLPRRGRTTCVPAPGARFRAHHSALGVRVQHVAALAIARDTVCSSEGWMFDASSACALGMPPGALPRSSPSSPKAADTNKPKSDHNHTSSSPGMSRMKRHLALHSNN